jgi:hypothetical protein
MGQFEKVEGLAACDDPDYLADLALWARHRDLVWTPGKIDAALPDLIRNTRNAGLLLPEAAFIALETQSQEIMLSRKERQSLSANHDLEFDEQATKTAPAPSAVWLILPALWFIWRKKSGNPG